MGQNFMRVSGQVKISLVEKENRKSSLQAREASYAMAQMPTRPLSILEWQEREEEKPK